jgi:hypothetical protein
MREGQTADAAPGTPAAKSAGSVSAASHGTALMEKTAYRCAQGALIFVADCAYGDANDTKCWTERYVAH